jgi:hypothetical protein
MPRLLTDEQVERIANDGSCEIASEVASEVGGLTRLWRSRLEEAIEHDLTECLEGLMEPDAGEGS